MLSVPALQRRRGEQLFGRWEPDVNNFTLDLATPRCRHSSRGGKRATTEARRHRGALESTEELLPQMDTDEHR